MTLNTTTSSTRMVKSKNAKKTRSSKPKQKSGTSKSGKSSKSGSRRTSKKLSRSTNKDKSTPALDAIRDNIINQTFLSGDGNAVTTDDVFRL